MPSFFSVRRVMSRSVNDSVNLLIGSWLRLLGPARARRSLICACGLALAAVLLLPALRGAARQGAVYARKAMAPLPASAHASGAAQASVPVEVLSAASFEAPVAPDSIAVGFGSGLSKNFVIAPPGSLPTQLDGTTVAIKDSAGAERLAQLFYVTPIQISFLVPGGTAPGATGITVRASDGAVSQGSFDVVAAAPGIFTANANGKGVPAAYASRYKPDGSSADEAIAQGVYPGLMPRPIDLGTDDREQVFLVLYATGLKGVPNSDGNAGNGSAENVRALLGGLELTPTYVGPYGFAGAEQINLLIPRTLIGRGRIKLSLAVLNPASSQTSNQTEIEIAGQKSDAPPVIERTNIGNETSVGVRDLIEIFGQRFSEIPRENTVRIGNIEARVEEASATRLLVRVPFGAESAPLTVITNGREGRSNAAMRIRTSISGVVKDTRQQPIPQVNITLKSSGKTVSTDSEGVFVIPDLQNDGLDLMLVDGSSVPFSLNYPNPPVKINVTRNRDNVVESPIYLQQVSGAQITVGGSNLTGEDDLALTAAVPDLHDGAGVIGEIRLTIAPGTRATFPDGSTRGTLTLNAVENSLTPIKLPNNVFSSTIAQIANFGVLLDKGGKLSFPNTDKLPPDTPAVLYKYQVAPCAPGTIATPACRRGEWVQAQTPVTVTTETIETAENAITETSYYFVAAPRATTTATGRVVEDTRSANNPPIRDAVVRVRGQEAVTDGNGGFVVSGVPVGQGDEIAADVSWTRPDGRVFRQQGSFTRAVVNGLTSLGEIKIETEATNRAPIALLPAVINLTAGKNRDIGFSAADPDAGQTITLDVDDKRIAQIRSDGNNLYTLRLMPTLSDAGVKTLNLSVTDNLGKSQTYEIRLVVRLPITAKSDTVTTDEDMPVNITLIANDPENRPLVYGVGVNPANGRLTINGNAATYTPRQDYNDADQFTFFATNGVERSNDAMIKILIRSINDPPVLNVPAGVQSVNSGTPISFPVSATDPDSANLAITSSNLPAGAACRQTSSASCQFEWTPTGLQTGSYQIKFKVEDDDATQKLSDEKTVAIMAINRAPVLRGVEPQTVDEAKNLSFTLTASDPDAGQTQTFTARNLPAGATLNPNGQFNWTPNFTQSGSYDLTFTVTDNGDPARSDNGVVRVTVNNVNQSPIASDQVVATDEDTALNIALSANDPDGDLLTYTIVNNPTNGTLSGSGANRSYLPKQDFNGSDSFTFKVNDGNLDSNAAVVTISVRPVNDPPVLIVPARQQATVGKLLSFTVTATDVDEGQSIQLEARDLPLGASFNPATGEFAWTPKLEQRGTRTVAFIATDNGRPPLSDRKTVEIVVDEEWRQTNGPVGGTVLALANIGPSIFAGTEGGIYVSSNDGASWTQIAGLRGFTVRALLVRGQRIYAGTEEGVYLSTDNGATWRPIKTGLPNKPVLALTALNAGGQNLLFAGTFGGGVFVSNNDGALWRELSDGLPVKPGTTNREVFALATVQGRVFAGTNDGVYVLNNAASNWSPSNNGLPGAPHIYSLLPNNAGSLYAATNDGVFVTGDAGGVWRNISEGLPANTAATALAFSGASLFAGTYGGGVYTLGNNAARWSPLNNGLAQQHVLALTVLGNNIFAGTEGGGVYVAGSGASSWTPLNNGLTTQATLSLAASGANLFAGTFGGGVFVSTNNGASWTPANNGLASRQIFALAVSGANLFAGTNDGVFVSSDNGASWSPSNNGMPGAPNVYALLVAGGRIFAGTNKGVFVTSDNGASWTQQMNSGLPANRAVTALLANGNSVLAGTYGAGVFMTNNNGANWASANAGLTSANIFALAAAKGKIYAGTEGGGVFASSSSSVNWSPANNGLPPNVSVASLLASGENIFAGTLGSGIYVTTNEGASWTQFNNGLPQPLTVPVLIASGNTLFAGTDKGVFAAFGNVTTWRAANAGLTGATALALTINGENLFAGTYGNGAHRTGDGGATWLPINNGLARNRVFALLAQEGNIFAGTNDGAYLSRDNGANWTEANNGLTELPQIYAFAASGQKIFAATNDGVFTTTDNGANWTVASNGLPSDKAIISLAVSGNFIFAGTYQGGLFVTTNNGLSWARADNGLPPGIAVLALAVGGANIFAGTDKGIFVSNNNGGTWQPANTGLPPGIPVTALASSGDYVFAGTYGGGVFVSSNNGARWVPTSRGIVMSAPNNPGNPLAVVSSLTIKQGTLYAGIAGRGVFALKF